MISVGKVAFVRMDRIGDLILTLPVDQMAVFSDIESIWIVPKGLGFIAAAASPKRKYLETSKKFNFNIFFQLILFFRDEKFSHIFIFHAPWWVGFAAWIARIPRRVGVKSQWHSFLFFNKSVRQKRSLSEHHESEYNRMLVEEAFSLSPQTPPSPLFFEPNANDNFVKKNGLTPKEYFVIHPGMGGSARNWPTEHYVELIRSLQKNYKIVVTGSGTDLDWVRPIRSELGEHSSVMWIEPKNETEWFSILTCAKAVLAPSTGTAHIAASLEVPVVAIFSPVRVQAPRRWRPIGKYVSILVPKVECPGQLNCLGEACSKFDCMREISVEQVKEELLKWS